MSIVQGYHYQLGKNVIILIFNLYVLMQILDSKDLNIIKITETELEKPLNYSLGEAVDGFGSKLTIELPPKPSGR